jgi:hypothetical protein
MQLVPLLQYALLQEQEVHAG